MKQVMIAAVFVLICTAFGQAPPSFEVASVKLQPWTGQGSVGIMLRGVTLTAEHVSLKDLVTFAYDLRDVQLSGGPSWADRSGLKLNEAELYEVIGRAAGDTPPSRDEFRRMLQALLADRFQLRIHHQSKDLSVYNLVVAKGGPKFKESAADTKFDAK